MKRLLLTAPGLLALALALAPAARAQVPFGPQGDAEPPRFPDFNLVVKGAKEYEGLFKLYQKDERVLMEIQPFQFDKPILCPIAVARGAGLGGFTLNFDEQWVLLFKRVGDKVHLIRRNVHFKAKTGSPVAKAVEVTYSDSILMALKILAINQMKNQAVLISLNDIFMSDFAELGLGGFDVNRSTWHKIKTFPRNLELEVQATYSGGRRGASFGDDGIIDARGNTVVIHYGLA